MRAGMGFSRRPSLIEGHAKAGGWVVGGRLYPCALLVTREGARSFGPLALEQVGAEHLPPDCDMLLLGTGQTLQRPPAALVELARARGTRIEAMDSGAAARTFNLLVQEERPVAALLL